MLPRLIPILLLACLCAGRLTAQNLSFERVDSAGHTVQWTTAAGKAQRVSALFFNGYPFLATDQSYFLVLENDSSNSPATVGTISSSFPFADTPSSISFDAFYYCLFTYQRYGVKVLLTRWNGNGRDTILYKSTGMEAVTDSTHSLLIRWSQQQFDLGNYTDTTLPDSATLMISADAVAPAVNSSLLLMDNIHFGKWRTGINEISDDTRHFEFYPNPATNEVFIQFPAATHESELELIDALGRTVKKIRLQAQRATADVSDLPAGMYIMRLNGGRERAGRLMIRR